MEGSGQVHALCFGLRHHCGWERRGAVIGARWSAVGQVDLVRGLHHLPHQIAALRGAGLVQADEPVPGHGLGTLGKRGPSLVDVCSKLQEVAAIEVVGVLCLGQTGQGTENGYGNGSPHGSSLAFAVSA
ncbi:hypothetical protein D3C84_932600 [compost metagenome]